MLINTITQISVGADVSRTLNGLPTSSPKESHDIVSHRHPIFGLRWLPQASMPSYDVLAFAR